MHLLCDLTSVVLGQIAPKHPQSLSLTTMGINELWLVRFPLKHISVLNVKEKDCTQKAHV